MQFIGNTSPWLLYNPKLNKVMYVCMYVCIYVCTKIGIEISDYNLE